MKFFPATIRAKPLVFVSSIIVFLILTSPIEAQRAKKNFDRERSFDATNYTIRVSFDRSKKKVFGDTTVSLIPSKDDFTQVELDAVDLSFDSVELIPGNIPLKYKLANGKIIINLDRTYNETEMFSIRMKYSTIPKKGIYFVEAQVEKGKETRAAQIWTQGEPDETRHWFPSFDFPSDKATTEEFITVEKGETVIGNGELIEQIENPDGTVTAHYRMLIPHSTYLVSFVVGKYEKVADKYKDVPLGFYIYPGSEAIVPKAFGKTKDVLRTYEELTGIAFPYNKYDQTIVSDFKFGGMENITATTMADSEIFFANFEFGRNAVEDLVSHEAAHSWFGDLVTCKNWAELWLNEGFATFMESAYREKMYGRESYIRKLQFDAAQFLADDAVNKKRNGLFNENADKIDELFDRPATTYNKGGAVIHMLREQVGDVNFWKAINLYLNKHKFANVETADLKAAMEEVSGQDLGWFFNQWVYATGAPNLNITYRYDIAKKQLVVTVKQTQNADKTTPAAFILPIELTIGSGKQVRHEKLDIKQRVQTFAFKAAAKPTSITIDPNERIILKTVKLTYLK